MVDRNPILVTGVAGFIGYHVALRLLRRGEVVMGIDNLNDYYDVRLKEARLQQLSSLPGFCFEKVDVADRDVMIRLFGERGFPKVIHLAAQAGVRHSLAAPHAYAHANLVGFLNVLEGCRQVETRHLVYASSSSVYGANTRTPFRTSDNVDHPLSLYGATKKANELMAHAYAHLFAIPATGVRLFTVYGPWGRPDMAVWLFTAAILECRPIRLFNHGRMRRDFTYIDDAAETLVRLMARPPRGAPGWSGERPDPASSLAPWRIYNIGNSRPIELGALVEAIEAATGRAAIRELLPMQPGDVEDTCADVADLEAAVEFVPCTPIDEGVRRFVSWYRAYAEGQG